MYGAAQHTLCRKARSTGGRDALGGQVVLHLVNKIVAVLQNVGHHGQLAADFVFCIAIEYTRLWVASFSHRHPLRL